MKKTILLIVFILTCYYSLTNLIINKIPEEAIRLRIVANSDSKEDQDIKNEIKVKVQKKLTKILKNISSIEEARTLIQGNLNALNPIIKEISPYNFDINYGLNYFPEKIYQGITYDEGYYESLLITLGNGEGHNWWCVLYPSTCFLDEDVEMKSWFKEIIDKI